MSSGYRTPDPRCRRQLVAADRVRTHRAVVEAADAHAVLETAGAAANIMGLNWLIAQGLRLDDRGSAVLPGLSPLSTPAQFLCAKAALPAGV